MFLWGPLEPEVLDVALGAFGAPTTNNMTMLLFLLTLLVYVLE